MRIKEIHSACTLRNNDGLHKLSRANGSTDENRCLWWTALELYQQTKEWFLSLGRVRRT